MGADDATFQAAMAGYHPGRFPEKCLVSILKQGQCPRSGIGLPARIGIPGFHGVPCQGKDRFDAADQVCLAALARRACQAPDVHLPVPDTEKGQVVGGLGLARKIMAHIGHPAGQGAEAAQQLQLFRFRHANGGGIGPNEGNLDRVFHRGEFTQDGRPLRFENPGECLARGRVEGEQGPGLAGDGIAQGPTRCLAQAKTGLPGAGVKQPGQYFVGVRTPLVDVHATVPALQAAHPYPHAFPFAGQGFGPVGAAGRYVDAARAPHVELVVFFRVEVQQEPAPEPVGRKGLGPAHASFLVYREKRFQGGVFEVPGLEHGHDGSHPQAIVGPQGGAPGPYPVSVDKHIDAPGLKIEGRGFVLLVHHVEMGLEHHPLPVLVSRAGRFADQHVANRVAVGFQAQRPAESHHEGRDAFLPFGGPGNSIQGGKVFPDFRGLQLRYGFRHKDWICVLK